MRRRPAPLDALRPGSPRRPRAPAALDRTAKLYVGGKQARPDSGYSYAVLDPKGREVGLAGLGNRKDIRNAVEAAAKAVVLGRGDRAQPGAGALLRRRELERARRRVRAAPARHDGRFGARRGGRGRSVDPPRLLLRRLRRQVRRRGPRDALALRHAGDERALGRDGDRLPGRSAAARLRLARHAGDRDGQLRRRRPVVAPSLERDRSSIPSSTRRMFPPASSTSSPAKRTRSPRRSPSTTASTRSGTSATRRARRRSRPFRPAI